MDSRNVWGDFHIYTFQIYKEVQEQMLGAGHGSACLSSHLASMARLILFLYNLQSGQNSRAKRCCARHNASTLLLTGPLHGEVQPTPPQSDTPTPAGSTRSGQVFPPEKHRPERHSVVVFPGRGECPLDKHLFTLGRALTTDQRREPVSLLSYVQECR